tara:strand:- start:86 stop:949 length:864 start_codon:yes stop_codon:yes gene_type:complete
MAATRGDFAVALYTTLGITGPSSTGAFSDGGVNDGIYSTLSDLGITNGVGGGRFGAETAVTRGQAFTMMARALGLADASTSIEDASRALVDAGLVKGYGNTGELGLNDPLKPEHMAKLMTRMEPELARVTDEASGATVGSGVLDDAATAGQESQAATDPAYAAFLIQQGINLNRVGADIDQRQSLYDQDSLRRSETYASSMLDAKEGINADFENRGFMRSGTRLRKGNESDTKIGAMQERESYAAQRAKEQADQRDERVRQDLLRSGATAYQGSQDNTEYDEAEDAY